MSDQQTMPPPPPAPEMSPAEMAGAEADTKKGRRGRKREKAEKVKAPKVKAPKAQRSRGQNSLLSLSDDLPNRQQMEQEAAAELTAAIAPSLDLLRRDVPDAASPDDAYRAIESKLGPAPQDADAALPAHPIYKGDALVYRQLQRHYGKPHPGGSFWRSWTPGEG
jgi:hypothetical protein